MNRVKFRQVGRPSAPVVIAKVSQSKRAIYGFRDRAGKLHKPQAVSVGRANKALAAKGFIRCGGQYA